jgi:hypothetical protein
MNYGIYLVSSMVLHWKCSGSLQFGKPPKHVIEADAEYVLSPAAPPDCGLRARSVGTRNRYCSATLNTPFVLDQFSFDRSRI